MRAFLSLTLLLGACGASEAPAPPADGETPAAPFVRDGDRIVVGEGSSLRERLVVAALAVEPVTRALDAPARVEADPARIARITPPLAGRIVRVDVHFGQEVQAGDPLLTLDAPELVVAQTELLNAQTELAQADRNLARVTDLREHGIASVAELEEASTRHAIAIAELARCRGRLRLLGGSGGTLGRALVLRSPIHGRVVELAVSTGEFRSDLAQSLMTIADLSTVWVTADVQERDLARVSVGMAVHAELAAYPDEPLTGSVLYVGDLLDPGTRTLPIRIAFENRDGRLHPGMFARVTFEETARPEILVPSPAVVLTGDADTVFVEVAPWTFERRTVRLGPPIEDQLIVVEGLHAGERVVVANAVLLQ